MIQAVSVRHIKRVDQFVFTSPEELHRSNVIEVVHAGRPSQRQFTFNDALSGANSYTFFLVWNWIFPSFSSGNSYLASIVLSCNDAVARWMPARIAEVSVSFVRDVEG